METIMSILVGCVIAILIRPLQKIALQNRRPKVVIPLALVVGILLIAVGYVLSFILKAGYLPELSKTESLLFIVIWLVPVFLSSIELLYRMHAEKV